MFGGKKTVAAGCFLWPVCVFSRFCGPSCGNDPDLIEQPRRSRENISNTDADQRLTDTHTQVQELC